MFNIIKRWSPLAIAEAKESRGKGFGRLQGGYIDDLASLKKAIWLCGSCAHKWNYQSYRYTVKSDLPRVNGKCDACQSVGIHTMFIPVQHRDGWNGL